MLLTAKQISVKKNNSNEEGSLNCITKIIK